MPVGTSDGGGRLTRGPRRGTGIEVLNESRFKKRYGNKNTNKEDRVGLEENKVKGTPREKGRK